MSGDGTRLACEDGLLLQNPRGGFKVWQWPDPYRKYTIGVDTAGGSANGDWSVAQVIENETCNQVAIWRIHQNPVPWGRSVSRLARFYNNALLAIETGVSAHGLSVQNASTAYGYQHHYLRKVQGSIAGQFTDKIGFSTTSKTKPMLIDRMRQALDDGYLIQDERTLNELRKLKLDENEKLISDDHDDCFMALAIAYVVRDESYRRGTGFAEPKKPISHSDREWSRWESGIGGGDEAGENETYFEGL